MHLLGQHPNKNSTHPKVSKTHQYDVLLADRLRKLEWEIVMEVTVPEVLADQDNPLPLRVQIVESKIQFRSSQKATDRFCVEIASATNAHKHKHVRHSGLVPEYR
jgi:hypothetical protein